ncbi:hypothetical protein IJT93_06115 [bacterium]|nr:hypothetical protein [bacterium]
MDSDTFNPNIYSSAAEALQALRREGVSLNHRLGARVCALGRRLILFSWAFLEEAADSEAFGECLRDKRWNSLNIEDSDTVASVLQPIGAVSKLEDGILKVYTEDEEIASEPGNELALRSEMSGSVAPAVLGIADLSGIKGLLWDRQRIEEASLTLLDSEDNTKLVEAFRYLFRAGITCGQDPTGLLITAFKRGKPALSSEVMRQVRDNLDRDLGRALINLLGDDPKKCREALRYFNKPEQERFLPILKVILIPALLPLVHKEGFKKNILPGLLHLAPLIGRVSSADGSLGELLAFLDALLDDLGGMELSERFALSAFIYDLALHSEDLRRYTMERFRNAEASGDSAFLGNILARLPMSDPEYKEIKDKLIELFAVHGSEAGLSRRLRATFRFLGTDVLTDLCQSAFLERLDEGQRMFVVNLWDDFRRLHGSAGDAAASHIHSHGEHESACECGCHEADAECAHEECGCCGHGSARGFAETAEREEAACGHEKSEAADFDINKSLELWQNLNGRGRTVDSEYMNRVFTDFVLGRLISRDKAASLALVHTGQIDLPVVKQALQNLDSQRYSIYSFLFEESCRLEDPDDKLVLDLLASCGPGGLEFSFKVISEEAALESGGEAGKIAVFGRLLHREDLSVPHMAERINEMTAAALNFPSLYERPKYHLLPVVWEGLGLLGSVPCINEDVRRRIVERLSEKLSKDPQAKVDALLEIYRAAGAEVKALIETELRRIFTDPEPDRRVLRSCLEGLHKLLSDGPLPVEIEALISTLCRTVLSKSKEPSLDDIMKRMLSKEAEGDGVQIPTAWSHEDKLTALRILGAAACHKQASERLHRVLVYRLFSFLDDWFAGVEKGSNLYAYRSNPIWRELVQLLEVDRSDFTVNLAREAALRLMADYSRRLEGCDLVQSEAAQQFLLEALRCSQGFSCEVNGIKVDLSHAIINVMMEAVRSSPPDNKVSLSLLRGLLTEDVLSAADREELSMFVAAQAD